MHPPSVQDQADARNNLAISLIDAGRLEQAVLACHQAIVLEPNFAEAHNNLAVALKKLGRLDEAITACSAAIALRPTYAEAHSNLGNALFETGRIEPAITAYRRALDLKPDYLAALNNLGTALGKAGQFTQAIDAYTAAIKLKPDVAEVHNNLGVALGGIGRLDDAIGAFRRAIQINSGYAEAWANLGAVLCDSGDGESALAACRRAIELRPDLAIAHSNYALILLRLGHYELGWPEHEWRFKCNPKFRPRSFSQPRWDGSPLAGQTILLHAEQGWGDTIQFVRYAPLVASRGGRVILECQPELIRLLGNLPGVDQLVPFGQPLRPFDLHCPLLSLPAAIGTTLNSIPADVPYLHANSANWRERLNVIGNRLKVGLVWAGRPTHTNDHNRSMQLSHFSRLSEIPNVAFYSLQKGPAAAQTGLELIDFTTELNDFADTAALVGALDLVIAVDTAVAHLAGAIGKPVWVLLPMCADWRWMTERSDSPWYPTMRLFRQTRWGDWDQVVQNVARALT
jgi:tetratricopeptide (TPR) repeat protein